MNQMAASVRTMLEFNGTSPNDEQSVYTARANCDDAGTRTFASVGIRDAPRNIAEQ